MLHVMKKMNEIRDEIERGPRYDYENYAGTAACTRILPSREDRRKRLHCENDKGAQGKDTPLLSLSLSLFLEDSRGRDTEEKKRENSCEDILYSWTRALERRIVTGVQRGRNFGGVFSLKQLSIGFPLEEGCPSPASTIPRPGLLFRLEVKWPMNGKIEERILSKRKLVATPP